LTAVFEGWIDRVRWVITYNGQYYSSYMLCNQFRFPIIHPWIYRRNILILLKDLLGDRPKVINNFWTNWLIFEIWVLNNWECRNNNDIGTSTLPKMDENWLTGAGGYDHILVMPNRPTNEWVNPDIYTF
jgi:hypothetical protein